MARLTADQRRNLPAKDFAGPGRTFPVEDKTHAREAVAEVHNAPPSERAHISAVAEAKLHPGARHPNIVDHKVRPR